MTTCVHTIRPVRLAGADLLYCWLVADGWFVPREKVLLACG
jgi:hypothetical protein